MEDADLSREIPVTPVRSSSENSGVASSYSDATSSIAAPPGANDSIASGLVPPSPQRSYQGHPPSVSSSPVSVARSTNNNNNGRMSPPDIRNTTPMMPKSGSKVPMQPDLQTPTFNEDVEVADLLGDYSHGPRNFSHTPRPRVLYTSDDEETDPTSSLNDYPAYGRNGATSTFGKVIQPLKVRHDSDSCHFF